MQYRTFMEMFMRLITALAFAMLASVCMAQTEPSTKPSASPQVKAILDQVGAAYAKSNALSMSGKISLDSLRHWSRQHSRQRTLPARKSGISPLSMAV